MNINPPQMPWSGAVASVCCSSTFRAISIVRFTPCQTSKARQASQQGQFTAWRICSIVCVMTTPLIIAPAFLTLRAKPSGTRSIRSTKPIDRRCPKSWHIKLAIFAKSAKPWAGRASKFLVWRQTTLSGHCRYTPAVETWRRLFRRVTKTSRNWSMHESRW